MLKVFLCSFLVSLIYAKHGHGKVEEHQLCIELVEISMKNFYSYFQYNVPLLNIVVEPSSNEKHANNSEHSINNIAINGNNPIISLNNGNYDNEFCWINPKFDSLSIRANMVENFHNSYQGTGNIAVNYDEIYEESSSKEHKKHPKIQDATLTNSPGQYGNGIVDISYELYQDYYKVKKSKANKMLIVTNENNNVDNVDNVIEEDDKELIVDENIKEEANNELYKRSKGEQKEQPHEVEFKHKYGKQTEQPQQKNEIIEEIEVNHDESLLKKSKDKDEDTDTDDKKKAKENEPKKKPTEQPKELNVDELIKKNNNNKESKEKENEPKKDEISKEEIKITPPIEYEGEEENLIKKNEPKKDEISKEEIKITPPIEYEGEEENLIKKNDHKKKKDDVDHTPQQAENPQQPNEWQQWYPPKEADVRNENKENVVLPGTGEHTGHHDHGKDQNPPVDKSSNNNNNNNNMGNKIETIGFEAFMIIVASMASIIGFIVLIIITYWAYNVYHRKEYEIINKDDCNHQKILSSNKYKKISLRSALQSIIIHENDYDNNNKEDSVQPIDSKQYTSYNSRDEVKICS